MSIRFGEPFRDVVEAALPTCFIGLTLQHSPILPRIAKSTKKLPSSFFPIAPIEKYFNAHPHRNIVFISDFFRDERQFKRSSFYRGCLVPINRRFAIGLFFWGIRRLLAAIVVVRSVLQGELSPRDMRLIRHPTRCELRATISLKQISSAAVARPHFLVEFESLPGRTAMGYQSSGASLPHLIRLTRREQNLARLVCDGRSNQEIADESGLSLETVKKHLHSIFSKLEVPSRSRLMTLMR